MAAKAPKLGLMKRLLPLVLVLSSTAFAESGAYRVEVIVFRNLAVTAEPALVETLRDFSAYPALEEVVAPIPLGLLPETDREMDEGSTEESELAETDTGDESPEAMETAEAFEPPHPDLPDDLRVIMEKSTAVDDAWRRLRGSKNYRPLLYAGWDQNRIDYYPPMRIHDQRVIDTQLRPPTSGMVADLTAPDPLAAYRSVFYGLDGSVQLRRSRFLHLVLDLEIREPGTQQAVIPAVDSGVSDVVQTNAGHLVYTLKQSRQVRTGRMHYFDTPHFGVLALVTAIRPE